MEGENTREEERDVRFLGGYVCCGFEDEFLCFRGRVFLVSCFLRDVFWVELLIVLVSVLVWGFELVGRSGCGCACA